MRQAAQQRDRNCSLGMETSSLVGRTFRARAAATFLAAVGHHTKGS